MLRVIAFAIITALLSLTYGCAGAPETFMERATAQTREVLQFNPCPYGVEEAALSSHASVNMTYTNDPALRSYTDYSDNRWHGRTQYYNAPREVMTKSAGGQRVTKCMPPPGVKGK
jgi:hypothetical protein